MTIISKEENIIPIEEALNLYIDWYSILSVIYRRDRVGTLDSIKFYIYDERGQRHHEPHLHVICNDEEQLVINLNTLTIIKGSISRNNQKKAIERIKKNKDLLLRKWESLNKEIILPIY